jgi:hypothetical protein
VLYQVVHLIFQAVIVSPLFQTLGAVAYLPIGVAMLRSLSKCLPSIKRWFTQGLRGQGVVWLLNPFRNPLFCRDAPANEFVEVTPMPGSGAVAHVAVGQDVYVLDTRRKIFKYQVEGESRMLSRLSMLLFSKPAHILATLFVLDCSASI